MRFHFKTSYDHDIRLFPDWWKFSLYAALLLLMLVLPWVFQGVFGDRTAGFYLGETTNVLIWSVAGLGLMLLTGTTGQVSLGHSAFMALGCFLCVNFLDSGMPFLLAFVLAGIVTGLIGAVIAVPALKLHGVYLSIFTLALAILADDLVVILEPWTGGVNGRMAPDFTLFGASMNRWANPEGWYFLALGTAIAVTLLYRNLLRSPLGRAFAAVRDSEISAQAMGIDVARTKTLAFGLSCAFAGLGGALMGFFAGAFNNETFNFLISIQLLMMIIIGGLGFIHGAFLGAAVIAFLPQALSMATDFMGSASIPGLEVGVFGAILIAFILFEPMGLYGRWLKLRVWLELFPFARRDMFRRQKSYLKTERLR